MKIDICIEKTLALSTAHITYETNRWLAEQLQRERIEQEFTSPLSIYAKIFEHWAPAKSRAANGFVDYLPQTMTDQFGWWIVVPVNIDDEDPEEYTKIPHDLQTILAVARSHECEWVLLDRDADTCDALPTFKWLT